jgi:uroporphyrinogen-III synthase
MAGDLTGVRVGVTGARKGAELGRALERKGAQAILGPTTAGDVAVEPEVVNKQSRAILDAAPTWVACTTGMGVRTWVEAAADDPNMQLALESLLMRARVVARGAKAEGALRGLGVIPEYVPPRELDQDVVAWLVEHVSPGEVVAACLHSQPEDVYDPVREAGATVLTVSPYLSGLPENPAPAVELIQQLAEGRLNVVVFTSPGAVRGLVQIARDHHLMDRVVEESAARCAFAAVGLVTANEAEAAGTRVSIMPTRPRTGALLREIEWWADAEGGGRTRAFVTLDPRELTVTTDEWVIPLASTEYEVLATLARRPMRILPHDVIATEVWGRPELDSSLADTILRLRDKLAGAVTIETVRNEGYRLVR